MAGLMFKALLCSQRIGTEAQRGTALEPSQLYVNPFSMDIDQEKRSHFVLLHGAGHGAWCWYKVTHQLQQAGHTVDAIDLTSAGINNEDAKTVETLERYTRPLVQLIQSLPEHKKVVLVGHSLGGLSLTYAMQHFPHKIQVAVFVAALMFPGGSNGHYLQETVVANNKAVQDNTVNGYLEGSDTPVSLAFKLETVDNLLYNLSPPEDVVLAKALLKPVPLFEQVVNITADKYGMVPRVFIRAKHDHIIMPELQDLMIQYNPPSKVIDMESDHSPFFSMPQLLVHHLLQLTK